MRAAVILAALAIKSVIWFRTMTPRDILILRIAAFALLVVMLTIAGMKQNEKHLPAEIICSDPPQRQINFDYELCEWKLRDARSRHPAAMRPLIG